MFDHPWPGENPKFESSTLHLSKPTPRAARVNSWSAWMNFCLSHGLHLFMRVSFAFRSYSFVTHKELRVIVRIFVISIWFFLDWDSLSLSSWPHLIDRLISRRSSCPEDWLGISCHWPYEDREASLIQALSVQRSLCGLFFWAHQFVFPSNSSSHYFRSQVHSFLSWYLSKLNLLLSVIYRVSIR